MDESILREHARAAIRTEKIPNRVPDRTWGGPGGGASCTLCGQTVTRDEKEFEIEFVREAPQRVDTFHVHIRCFAAWEFERRDVPGGCPGARP